MQTKNIYRLASLFIVLLLAISSFVVAHATVQSVAASVTFHPDADAYVIQSAASTNYGSTATLRVDNSPTTRSYLRFTVSGLNGSAVKSAILRIYTNSAIAGGFSVHALSNNSWAENTLTYANAPAAGTTIKTSKPSTASAWVDVDITSYVKTQGTYNLVLTTSSATNISMASREMSGKSPQLVVTAASQVAPTSTKTKQPAPTATKAVPPTPTRSPTASGGTDWQPAFPVRAAFYYPWFAEAWTQQGIYPYTNYTPSLGYYSSTDQNILKQHIAMMQYGNIQAGIASWWGQGSQTDTKINGLLTAANGTKFRWALYYENESQGDPSVSQIHSDLVYIHDHYGTNPNFLRVNGKFVIFVYATPADGCGMADRWVQANTVGAYVVLKVFSGFSSCASQPDSWHQYCPAEAADQQGNMSYAISPGFWLKGNSVRLARDINRWAQNVRDMVASGAKWQLVTTFSEWGEGTAVEPATQWASASGYGQYLDLLHTNGVPTP